MEETMFQWADTHTHLYAEEFDSDREAMVHRALEQGVTFICLPNIDEDSIGPMNGLVASFPASCFPMMGLHPCYVKEDYHPQLDRIEKELFTGKYIGVGEIGLDLYWDKTSFGRQEQVLKTQLGWAVELKLAVSLHTREATEETLNLIQKLSLPGLRGVFHCFGGSLEQAQRAVNMGFHLGIGGIVTFKNSNLPEVLKQIDPRHLVLETDAPYLAPVPYRGKRNESGYIPLVGQKLADIYGMSVEEIAKVTTENAKSLFHPDNL